MVQTFSATQTRPPLSRAEASSTLLATRTIRRSILEVLKERPNERQETNLGERCEGDSRSLESTYCSREVDVADAKQGGVGKEVRLVITAI